MGEKVSARNALCRNIFSLVVVLATVLLCLVACSDGTDSGLTEEKPTLKTELTAEEIYKKASLSVVEVTAESTNRVSTGTGFFIDNNGTLVTNYHVIKKCTSAKITLADGRSFVVNEVLGYSESKDLAILSIDCHNSIPLELRKAAVATGEKVYAIGSSLGLSGSMSEGIISTAEREIDGQIFIQTTTPISHGNSGGPLMDGAGMVVGITTASMTDGQNLNFAIPVSVIDSISRNSPTTLPEMFPQSVEWISECDFFYYDDDEAFVLVFQLSDEDEVPMSSKGKVDIRIVNDDGVTVYNKTHSFTEKDFFEWTENDTEALYLATIYIDPDDILLGTCAEGTVYFTVRGDDYYFDESTLSARGLPIKSHAYSQKVIAPTCTMEGYTTHTCTICGDTYTDSYIKATGHSWGSWITTSAPTVGKTGQEKRICSTCNASESRTIPALEEEKKEDDEPTAMIDLQFPQTPLYVNTIRFDVNTGQYGVSQTVRIDSISYRIDSFGYLYLYCSGEKTYDIEGQNSTYSCEMNWRLYDSDGYLIDYGWNYIAGLRVGEKFKNDKINVSLTKIVAGESYKLEVFDSSYE